MATLVARIQDLATAIAAWVQKLRVCALPIVIDGGGVAVAAGYKLTVTVPFACVITGWDLFADQTGSIVVDLKTATYSGWPATTSITGSAKPTLTTSRKATSSGLTGWTTSVAAGTAVDVVVDSAATLQIANLVLKLRKV